MVGGGYRVEIQGLIWGGQIGLLILTLCRRTVSRLHHLRMRNNMHRPTLSPQHHHHPQHPRYQQPSQPTALSISFILQPHAQLQAHERIFGVMV
jgi:hypothetical protein